MKRLISIALIVVMMASMMAFSALAENEVKVTVNGVEVLFDQPPVISSGRTLVPARAVFEALGASVYWDETENGGYVSVVTASKSVVLEVNRKTPVSYMITDNVFKVALDVPASVINGRTLVPLRAIGDALSCEVGWDGETRTASLEYTIPETDKLSDAMNEKNSALTYADAAKEMQAKYSLDVLSPVPEYEKGVKYFEGVAAEKQKIYKKSADADISIEEYPIYATVNGDYVSYGEYEFFLSMYADEEGKVSDEYKVLVDNAVKELAVSSVYAKENGVTVDKDLVSITDIYLNNICYGMDIDTYSSITGISKETVYSIAEKQALRNALYVKAVDSGEIDISEEALKAKFDSMFYNAKHILFKTVDDDMNEYTYAKKKSVKKLADDTLKRIKNGEDFDKLMVELSEDAESSHTGYIFTDGQMVTSFEEGVKALKVDEVSDVIESEYGYHIIKRLALSADTNKEEFEYYKNSIANLIASEYFAAKTPEWAEKMDIKIF